MRSRGMMSILRCDGSDLDFVEHFSLQRAHLIQANQFEQRQERDHNFHARGRLSEQIRKTHSLSFAHELENLLDLVRNAESLRENFAEIFTSVDPLDRLLESVDQLKNSDFVQRQRRVR